jgi:hypothetical protein
MFLSTKFILKGIQEKLDFSHGYNIELKQMQNWFINFDNSQIDKPTIVIDEREKAVVLYTNDALWEIVQKWQKKELANLTMIDGIKIWKEIKTIMEKKG